ncbi:MAG: hypothetical protein ACRDK0_14540 [Solirubrobacteraceae bacterium]
MAAQNIEIMCGGSADWGAPVRASATLSKTWYEAYLMNRFALEDGSVHYLKLRIVGIDEIDEDGEVPSGWGSLEFQDGDGDVLCGHTDWCRRDGVDGGVWTFSSGTGKWEGATGSAELVLYGMPEDLEMEQPPRDASRYYGFLEGTGRIDAPALNG